MQADLVRGSNHSQIKFKVQDQAHRDHSIGQSIAGSLYNHGNSYEQLSLFFVNYVPLNQKFDIGLLRASPSLKLKKYKESVYFGQFKESKREGFGIMIYNSGQIYEGKWVQDLRNGEGYQKFSNGCVYHGEYEKGKMQGLGKYIWPTGQIYDGEWFNNQKHGTGMWKSERGDVYIGEWVEGKANGFGVFTESNGNRYEGMFLMFVKHGEGVEKYVNGDLYKGGFHHGKFEGYGEFYWRDGSYFKGSFKNGVRCGQGIWKKSSGLSDKYEGSFFDNKKEGYGIYTWKSGHLYKGHYKANMRHGYGQMYWEDGNFYKGQWQNDVENGQGELFVGEGRKKGLFKNGVLVESENEQQNAYSPRKIKHSKRRQLQSSANQSDSVERYQEIQMKNDKYLSPFQKANIFLNQHIKQPREMNLLKNTMYNTIEEAKLVRSPKRFAFSPNPLVQPNINHLPKTLNMKALSKLNGRKSQNYAINLKNRDTKERVLHSSFQIHRLHRNMGANSKMSKRYEDNHQTLNTSSDDSRFAFNLNDPKFKRISLKFT